MDFFEIIDYLIPVVLGFYGFKWLSSPPEFGSLKGITTKYSKESEENWALAHSFGGKLSIAFAVVMLAIAIGKNFVPETLLGAVMVASLIINLALIFSLIPIINIYVKRRSR